MTTLSNDTLAVLKRRIKQLETAAVYDEAFLAVFQRAHDELFERRRMRGRDTEVALEAIQDNRRLRAALIRIGEALARERSTLANETRAAVANALNGTREPGQGRAILNLELTPKMNPDVLKANVLQLIDNYFATPQEADHGDDRQGSDHQAPGGAAGSSGAVPGAPADERGPDRPAGTGPDEPRADPAGDR